MNKLAVVAIGGNSLIKNKQYPTIEDQYEAVCQTARYIVNIIEDGYKVVITHGNGPQVGYILRRSEIAAKKEGMHPIPLVNCVADTQGAIGYQIQQAITNEFRRRNIEKTVVTIVTQVMVKKDDRIFKNPSKPIGSSYNKEEIAEVKSSNPGWVLKNDAGGGYRRVVASPLPLKIIESDVISDLVEKDYCVIAVGGGGIPVIETEQGLIQGIDAVIDKDLATAILARQLNADFLIISTDVEKVALNYGCDNQLDLDQVTLSELKVYREEKHFKPGSMLPKIDAVIDFIESGGKKAIITNPDNLLDAVKGLKGTHISR